MCTWPNPNITTAWMLDTVLPVLTNIVNISLTSGIYPSIYKMAIVKPLLKKSTLDPNDLKNYRPVSNLSFLSKMLEKVALTQLLSHLNSQNLIKFQPIILVTALKPLFWKLPMIFWLLWILVRFQCLLFLIYLLHLTLLTTIYYFTIWNTLSASKEPLLHGSGHIF